MTVTTLRRVATCMAKTAPLAPMRVVSAQTPAARQTPMTAKYPGIQGEAPTADAMCNRLGESTIAVPTARAPNRLVRNIKTMGSSGAEGWRSRRCCKLVVKASAATEPKRHRMPIVANMPAPWPVSCRPASHENPHVPTTVKTAAAISVTVNGSWFPMNSATAIVGKSFDDLNTTLTGYCTQATETLASPVERNTRHVSAT
mmetsp:Transcript_42089/g.116284  ORF Transcript_42089/g.116284 Transcript_42089/m.116284 type:complete len:201 (+) Transcript_42089:294-896(+)